MSKRIIIITISAVILVFLVVAVILLKKSGPSVENQNGVKESADTVALPSAGNEKIYEGSLPVESVKSADQPNYINQAVSDFNTKTLSEKDASLGYQQTILVDENKKVIPLDKFEDAQNISINKNLKNFLNQDDFQIANCNSGKTKNIALILNVKLFSDRPNIDREVADAMKNWEPYMLKDLHNYFYPGINFSEKRLEEVLSFKQGKYRYAEVSLPNGKTGSLNYGIVFDSIVISDSLKCLENIYNDAETGEL